MEASSEPWSAPDGVLEDRLEVFVDRSSIPALVVDVELRQVVRANRAALDYLGLTPDEVLGRPGADFLVEQSQEQVMRMRSLHGERTVTVRQVRTAFGLRAVELNVVPIDESHVLAQVIDLSDLLSTARSAQREVDELTRKATALESVAEHLAHDIRTPLTVIGGFAQLLVDRHDQIEPEDRREYLERISTSVSGLIDLTETLLQEARAGTASLPDQSMSAGDLVAAVRSITAAEVAEAGAVLTVTVDHDELPMRAASLAPAVINLVSNSVKYRDPARPLHIELVIEHRADDVVVTVRDNGRGLPDDPEALFEPGMRGASSKGTSGTGFGLAYVRATVEAFGGTVSASAVDTGAEMVITVPVTEPDAPTPRGGSLETGLSTQQLDRILEASPVPMVVIDFDLQEIVRVNHAAELFVGKPASELVGQRGRDLLDRDEAAERLRGQALSQPGKFTSEDVLIMTARGPVPARVAVAVVPDTMLAVAQVLPPDLS